MHFCIVSIRFETSNEIVKFYDKDEATNVAETLAKAGFTEMQPQQTSFNMPSENRGFGGGFGGFSR